MRLPGSKSISNRVLLLAGLSAGTTVIHDLLDSDDTQVMLDALRSAGLRDRSATAPRCASPASAGDCKRAMRNSSSATPAPRCAR